MIVQKTFAGHPVAQGSYSYSSVSSSYPISNALADSTSTNYAYITCTTGSRAESYSFFKFDCSSIPATATIKSVGCKAKGRVSSTSYISTRQIQLFYKDKGTAKGSATNMSTSTSELTLTAGTWTRAELDDCYIRFYGQRGTSNTTRAAYLYIYGATLTVEYEYDEITYIVSTSLSGNGTLAPNGDVEVLSGQGYSLTITPNNFLNEVNIKDNNVDVTSQLQPLYSNAFEVTTKSGASYGFEQNFDANCKEGWWQSTNYHQASSAAVCTVSFNLKTAGNVTLEYICYGESGYDYMIVSQMDGSLSASASADTTYAFTTKSESTSAERSYTFTNVSAGSHHFDVKYYKDSYTDSNWDSAQFTLDLPSGEIIGYVYDINPVETNHNIVVVIGSGEQSEILYKVNGVWKKCIPYKKVGNNWVLQTDLTTIFEDGKIYINNK